jgi:hypothetical protein
MANLIYPGCMTRLVLLATFKHWVWFQSFVLPPAFFVQLLSKLQGFSGWTMFARGWLAAEQLLTSNTYPLDEMAVETALGDLTTSCQLPALNAAIASST